jgi:hypothetical protein
VPLWKGCDSLQTKSITVYPWSGNFRFKFNFFSTAVHFNQLRQTGCVALVRFNASQIMVLEQRPNTDVRFGINLHNCRPSSSSYGIFIFGFGVHTINQTVQPYKQSGGR